MPSPIKNNWTLRKLITNTYMHKETRTRFVYKQRDMVKGIRIEEIKTYNGKILSDNAKTKFVIRTQSTPQYYPFYTPKDARGRPRKRQIKFKHQYAVTIQLDELSLDVPFRGRTGSQGRWDMTPAGRDRCVKKGRTFVIIPGTNTIRGINGDFFFRSSYIWRREFILFGRDWTNGQPPIHTNPHRVVFASKHFLAACQLLMERGFLK
jgi:hypothetical protein